jgi:hypothetical protein
LEVDCYPDRQDLNVELLSVAKSEGTLNWRQSRSIANG